MGPAIGQILPLAIGIAISPIPIIAAILILLSPKAKVSSVGFLIGWLLGITTAVVIFTLLSSLIPSGDPSEPKPIQGIFQLLLGVLLLLLAIRQWQGRPKADVTPVLPKWMQAIDRMGFWAAFGLGFLLSALNPKNLILAAGAGTDIGSAALDGGSIALVIVIFVLIAAITVLVPVVGFLVAAERLHGPLDALRGWLERENAVIMAILLLVMGVVLLGKGIGSF